MRLANSTYSVLLLIRDIDQTSISSIRSPHTHAHIWHVRYFFCALVEAEDEEEEEDAGLAASALSFLYCSKQRFSNSLDCGGTLRSLSSGTKVCSLTGGSLSCSSVRPKGMSRASFCTSRIWPP